ncbi:MAG: hypothetical protein IJZ70_07510 [Bacteroidales bacterium]|nr:hypothetical protein [Bacteroidales bacterium]
MDNNTLLSQELEEMRSQISILKDKLEKQNIINEEHIRRSMRTNISSINKTVTITIFLGIFALIYCTWFFWSQGCSHAFVISTAVMLLACLALTIAQRINLGRMDFSKGNLIETAVSLNKIKAHYKNWHRIAIPTLVIWFGWLMYEMIGILGLESPMAIGFCCGAAVGGIIGGILGFRINRKIVRKTSEILEQIEELQKGE